MSAFESKKYSWKSGFGYSVSADIVGGVLEKIEERDGSVSAVAFLEESRKPESETHSMFEWDDAVAAEKYRLRQSAQIINQLEVTIESAEGDKSTSGFVNVVSKGRKGNNAVYLNIETALSNTETRNQVLQNALIELQVFQRKYQQLSELSTLFEEISRLVKETI